MSQPALHNQLNDPDGFYEALLDAHEGLNPEQSIAFNARLILILANQIGDQALLVQCLALAQQSSSLFAPDTPTSAGI